MCHKLPTSRFLLCETFYLGHSGLSLQWAFSLLVRQWVQFSCQTADLEGDSGCLDKPRVPIQSLFPSGNWAHFPPSCWHLYCPLLGHSYCPYTDNYHIWQARTSQDFLTVIKEALFSYSPPKSKYNGCFFSCHVSSLQKGAERAGVMILLSAAFSPRYGGFCVPWSLVILKMSLFPFPSCSMLELLLLEASA